MTEKFEVVHIDDFRDIPGNSVKPGTLYVCKHEGRVIFGCPLAPENGCGIMPHFACCIKQIIGDGWDFEEHDGKVTLNPSIKLENPFKNYHSCGRIHLFIKENEIVWAEKPECFCPDDAQNGPWNKE